MISDLNTDLPVEIKHDMELMSLLVKARELYGTYKAILNYQDIDKYLVLKPFILFESFKSCEIGGNKIDQTSLFFLKYSQETDIIRNIYNYNNALLRVQKTLPFNFKLSTKYLGKLHEELSDTEIGRKREPGKLRTNVTWIGKKGSTIYNADFIPTAPREIPRAIANYVRYFNKQYCVDRFIELAISHAQFENIHPYNDANGRLGRLLIPVHAQMGANEPIDFFLSELIKENEYMYYQKLKDTRNNKWESYIKFFLQMIIDQLDRNIIKLSKINKIYKKDSSIVIDTIKPKNGKTVYDYIFSNITFTLKEMSKETEIDYQTIRNYTNKLVKADILMKDKLSKGEYVYTYTNMHNIHIPDDWVCYI